MRRQRKKKEGKIKNATPNIYDGIKFRSRLETFTYKELKAAGIEAEYEQHIFQLLPAFVSKSGKKYRSMKYKPDFVGKDFIIECKGYPNDAWPLRMKLFEYVLLSQNLPYNFYVVHTQEEVESLIAKLKEKL